MQTKENIVQELQNHNIYNTSKISLNGLNTIARLIDIMDGDTILCVIPCLNNYYKISIRLDGIDTPELKSINDKLQMKAHEAKQKIFEYISEYKCKELNDKTFIKNYLYSNCLLVWLECKNFDKYGRLLADVYKINDTHEKINPSLSNILLQHNLAYVYHGESKHSEEQLLHYFYD